MLQKVRGLSVIMLKLRMFTLEVGFPNGSEGKAPACVAGDPASIPGSGRSPGEGNGNPLQYSFLENPMDRAAWWATVHRVAKSQTRLSNYTLTLEICTYVSINTHSKMHIFECFMSRKDAGQRHFQIFSRVYGFAFTVRE